MNELIRIEKRNGVDCVNARELHSFLDSKRRYSDWIKARIEQFNFTENEDYTKVSQKNDTSGGIQECIEYFISIDMAKELSMVERNEKGKQARKYFIECEKKMNESRNAIKEIVVDIVQPILQQQNEFNKKLIEEVKSLKYDTVKQIPETKKLTVKEYCIQHNISSYNQPKMLQSIGRICNQYSRELNRSVQYHFDGSYNVGMYDTDIINHAVEMYRINDQKQNNLFGGN